MPCSPSMQATCLCARPARQLPSRDPSHFPDQGNLKTTETCLFPNLFTPVVLFPLRRVAKCYVNKQCMSVKRRGISVKLPHCLGKTCQGPTKIVGKLSTNKITLKDLGERHKNLGRLCSRIAFQLPLDFFIFFKETRT